MATKKTFKTFAKPEEGVLEQKMYGGKVTVRFLGPTEEKPMRHIYMVDGKRKTGVTTFCGIKDKSAGLVIWATELFREHLLDKFPNITEEDIWTGCKLHAVRKQEAANIGTEVHDWVEKYIKGEKPAMPERHEAQIGVNSFLDWVANNKVKFLSSERVIYSRKYDYVGKMDIEAKVNGKLCLIDIKTSNDLRNDYYMQTAAYVRADEEESGREYVGRWLIRLAKETEKEYKARMAKKNLIREKEGKEPIDFPAYQVFEAMYLDEQAHLMDRDFKAFLSTITLKKFEDETGFWANKNE